MKSDSTKSDSTKSNVLVFDLRVKEQNELKKYLHEMICIIGNHRFDKNNFDGISGCHVDAETLSEESVRNFIIYINDLLIEDDKISDKTCLLIFALACYYPNVIIRNHFRSLINMLELIESINYDDYTQDDYDCICEVFFGKNSGRNCYSNKKI